MIRISARMLPNTPRVCTLGKPCVYLVGTVCDEPRTNKGNYDAACHRVNNKNLLPHLTTAAPSEPA